MKDMKEITIRLENALKKYQKLRDDAKRIVDAQQPLDVSFQAEVEDEKLLIAEKQLEAVRDMYNIAMTLK